MVPGRFVILPCTLFNSSKIHQAAAFVTLTTLNIKNYSTKNGPWDKLLFINRRRNDSSSSFTRVINAKDREINLFGPRDPRAPLPGNIGFETVLIKSQPLTPLKRNFLNPGLEDPDVVTSEMNEERHVRIAAQLHEEDEENQVSYAAQMLSLKAYTCPDLLAGDLKYIVPANTAIGSRTTVIMFRRREFLEDELGYINSNELRSSFFTLAKAIVTRLQVGGYWARVVDPNDTRVLSSIRAGPSRVIESVDRYKQLGYDFQRSGSCKVINYHTLGSSDFVGAVLTNAAAYSYDLRLVINRFSW